MIVIAILLLVLAAHYWGYQAGKLQATTASYARVREEVIRDIGLAVVEASKKEK